MKNALAFIIAAASIALGIYTFPGLKGPFNRVRNNVNETLNDEFVVDNYRAEALRLKSQRDSVVENIKKFSIEKRVAEAKLENAKKQASIAKENLLSTGAADLVKFNRAKDAYETCRTEVANLTTLVGTYDNAVKKLEDTRSVIDGNIQKLKVNIATLQSKKAMAESLQAVNRTIEELSGVGQDTSLGYTVEKLDDTILEESIKLTALDEHSSVGDAEDAQRYLEAVKKLEE